MRGVAVRELLTRLLLLAVSSTIALYAVETYLELHPSRTKLETVLDLRRRGVDAYPAYSPSFRVKVPPAVMPLSGVRLVTTVLGGDSGPVLYDSDEFGFRNPRDLWEAPPLDIVILGDSFAQGYGAPAGTDIGSVIRRTHPRTLNLGIEGTGQVVQLATAREFVARLRPRRVVVLYFQGNDVLDTANELIHPQLGRYY